MKIKQHIPNFCAGFEPKVEKFKNLEELLNIEWVKHFSELKKFYQYSVSDRCRLMAEYDDGYSWYVIGYLDIGLFESMPQLPEWVAKYKEPSPEEKEAERKRIEEFCKRSEEKLKEALKSDFLYQFQKQVNEKISNILKDDLTNTNE